MPLASLAPCKAGPLASTAAHTTTHDRGNLEHERRHSICNAPSGIGRSQWHPHGGAHQLAQSLAKTICTDRAGGGLKLTKLKDLSFFERTACTFNLLAGLFVPFYYIAKGMWKKGLAYWGLGIAGILVLETLVTVAGFGHLLSRMHYTGAWVALFAMMANRDCYKKVMLGDNAWL